MSAFADVFKVLYEPTEVFNRVKEKPRFLAPYLVMSVVQIAIGILNLPYLKAGITASMAGRTVPAGSPDPANFAIFGVLIVPIFLVIIFLLSALILWVLVSIFGGEGRFGTLLSVTTYAAVPAVILLTIVGTLVLRLKGVEAMTSPQDMQPALGLDLLAPSMTGFLLGVLKGINPFSIWGLVLTAIGVSVTHNLPRNTGYTVATISFVIGLLLAGMFASMGSGRMGGG